jgi:predicted dehydrogenase
LISVLLIGCGNAALTIGDDKRFQNFSHVSALKDLNIEITAIIDNCPSSEAKMYARNNNIVIHRDYDSVIEEYGNKFDLGIFCLPTTNADVTKEILQNINFKRVLLEKPVSYDSLLAKEIFSILRNNNSRFIVNYQRNWDLGYDSISKWIQNNVITDAYFRTSSAIAQSGSHMIELILRFFPSARVEYSRPLQSRRLVGGKVAEPGASIIFSQEDTQIYSIFDSPLPDEFLFSGKIYSTTGCLYFDEGEGVITLKEKVKGNVRIGSQIIYYKNPSIVYEWTNEDWLKGCYEALMDNDNLISLQDRSIEVVKIIENIMDKIK